MMHTQGARATRDGRACVTQIEHVMHAFLFAHLVFKNAFQGDDEMLWNAQDSVPSMQILSSHCDVYVLVGTVHCFDLDLGLWHALALQARRGEEMYCASAAHAKTY